jgi:nucleotide-binding universal stress UspA family protein
MRAVMVPLDGSRFAESALPHAVQLAKHTGAKLHLVLVHDVVRLPLTMEGAGLEGPDWAADARAGERAYLESTAGALRDDGVTVHIALLEIPIVESLARYAAEQQIDVVVMTTHGRGGLSRLWLGGVADGLMRRGTVPLWLIRPTRAGQVPLPEAALPRHVLIPLDGSERSEAVLAPALALAAVRPATVTLLHVVPPPFVAGQPYALTAASFDEATLLAEQRRAAEYLARVAGRVPPQVAAVERVVMTESPTSRAIIDYATEHDVDLVACSTQGRGGLSRVALGSVADKLVRGSQAPVLVVRTAGPAAQPDAEAEAAQERAADHRLSEIAR